MTNLTHTLTNLPRLHPRFGWKPDTPDNRDHIYSAPHDLIASLPPRVDHRPAMKPVPIEDQGQLGSCTGNATIDSLEALRVKCGKPHRDLSRLFAYYNGRAVEGSISQDSGCQIRDVVKQLAKIGTPLESLWPYNIAKFAIKPSAEAYADAPNHRLIKYVKCDTIASIKAAIAQGYNVVFGFQCYSSIDLPAVANTGNIPFPQLGWFNREAVEGGHCILAVGYDDAHPCYLAKHGKLATDPHFGPGALIIRNSWGSTWGEAGHGYLPYAYFTHSLADDPWSIQSCQDDTTTDQATA